MGGETGGTKWGEKGKSTAWGAAGEPWFGFNVHFIVVRGSFQGFSILWGLFKDFRRLFVRTFWDFYLRCFRIVFRSFGVSCKDLGFSFRTSRVSYRVFQDFLQGFLRSFFFKGFLGFFVRIFLGHFCNFSQSSPKG